MRNSILTAIIFISFFAWAVPKEQDRAILEKGKRELLVNPGFEAGKSGWTATGSSVFTIITASPGNGKAHAAWDPSATGEYLQSDLIPIPEKLKGRDKCSISGEYKWGSGTSGHLKLQAYDGTTVLGEVELAPANDWTNMPPIMITCPSTSLQWRLESTADAALISLEDLHLGELDTIQVSQGRFMGGISKVNGDAGCIPLIQARNVGYQPFVADLDCTNWTELGEATNASVSGIPKFDIYLPKGEYGAEVNIEFGTSTLTDTNTECIYSLDVQGAKFGLGRQTLNDPNDQLNPASTFTSYFSNGVAEVKTVELQASQAGGTTESCGIRLDGTTLSNYTIKIFKIAGEAKEAITLETSGYHVDVNIGGANPNLGITSQPNYIPIGHASLDLIINPGSAPAKILCSGGNPATGLTCAAGTEHVGISFEVPTAGRYRVCAEYTMTQQIDSVGDNIQTTFQLVESADGVETGLQVGDSRMTTGSALHASTGPDSVSGFSPVNLCGNFTFNSSGSKNIRVQYEQQVAGTPVSSVMLADRSTASGLRDIHFTVEKLDEQKPTPVFTDLQDSLNEKMSSGENGIVMYGAVISDTAVCSIFSTIGGSWLSGITDNGTGDCTVNFAPGFFDGITQPLCTFTTTTNSGFIISGSASNYRMQAVNIAGAQSNFAGAHLICIGKK